MHFYACVYTLVRQVSSVRARTGSLLQPGAPSVNFDPLSIPSPATRSSRRPLQPHARQGDEDHMLHPDLQGRS